MIASITQDGKTLQDTSVVRISATPLPAPLTALSIQPHPGGLTNAQMNLSQELFVPIILTFGKDAAVTETMCTESNSDRCPLVAGFVSSDPSVASIKYFVGVATHPVFIPLQPGRVTITASTIAYGVHRRDSLRLSVGYNKLTNTDVSVIDASHNPPLLGLRRDKNFPPPYSVGVWIVISNSTGAPVEVSLPSTPQGAHFFSGADWSVESPKTKDTLVTNAKPENGKALIIRLDSAGTYILHYRHLNTGAIVEDTFPVRPYP